MHLLTVYVIMDINKIYKNRCKKIYKGTRETVLKLKIESAKLGVAMPLKRLEEV